MYILDNHNLSQPPGNGGRRDGGQENLCFFAIFCDFLCFLCVFLLFEFFSVCFSVVSMFFLCFLVFFSMFYLTPKPSTTKSRGGTNGV